MAVQYVVEFFNDSLVSGSICLFQTLCDKNSDAFSVAWMVRKCHPGSRVTYRWNTVWNLAWCQTGKLSPDTQFSVSQVVGADPNDAKKNCMGLSKQNGAYLFVPSLMKSTPGHFYIQADNSVPNHDVSVGIGMAGFPTVLVQAGPNLCYQFAPQIQYWACFGNYEQGQILDSATLEQAFPFEFPVNVNGLTLTLNQDNQWSCENKKVPRPDEQPQ